MNEERDRELEARLSALPRSIEPERDLWSGIAARIEPKPAVRRIERAPSMAIPSMRWAAIGALAAAAAVALVAKTDRGTGTNTAPTATVVVAPPPPFAPEAPAAVAPEAIVPEEASYRAALGALSASFARSRANLPPASARGVDQSLKVIDAAIAATRAALAQNPTNAELRGQLGDEYQQAIDVLSDVVALPSRT